MRPFFALVCLEHYVDSIYRNNTFNMLFGRLSGHWTSLFPSTRKAEALPFGAGQYLANHNGTQSDFEDAPVWGLLGILAVHCDMSQQQQLVLGVRDKVLECVNSKKWASPEVSAVKIVSTWSS